MTLEERAQEIGCAWFTGGKAAAAEKLKALLDQARVEGARAMQAAALEASQADFIEARDTEWDQGVNYARRLAANNIRNLNPEAIAKEVGCE